MDVSSNNYFNSTLLYKQSDFTNQSDISETAASNRWSGHYFPCTPTEYNPFGYRSMVDDYYTGNPYYTQLPPVYHNTNTGTASEQLTDSQAILPPLYTKPWSLDSSSYPNNQSSSSQIGFADSKSRRMNSGSKKERRRTISINGAFSNLRDCIPNVPKDTKLSKIKTLRLASGYIKYLMEVLENDGQVTHEFKADLSRKTPCRAEKRKCIEAEIAAAAERKARGRSGWPQTIWAQDLKGDKVKADQANSIDITGQQTSLHAPYSDELNLTQTDHHNNPDSIETTLHTDTMSSSNSHTGSECTDLQSLE